MTTPTKSTTIGKGSNQPIPAKPAPTAHVSNCNFEVHANNSITPEAAKALERAAEAATQNAIAIGKIADALKGRPIGSVSGVTIGDSSVVE